MPLKPFNVAWMAPFAVTVAAWPVMSAAETSPPNKPAAAAPPVVQVEHIQPVSLADVVSYPARVEPKVKAAVLATTEGVVTTIKAAIGRSVRAGEALLMVKNTDPVYEYVPVPVLAPVAGVVSGLDVSVGSRITKGQALATVIDPKQSRLVVEVPAADIEHIKSGLTGHFSLPALGDRGRALPVVVTGISPLVDPLTGTATAELDITSQTMVPPGALGKATFSINPRSGLQVPEAAVVYRGNATFLRTVVAGKVKQLAVVLGPTRRGMIEVTSGLTAGADVIVRTSAFIADGQEVTVKAEDVAKK